MQHRQIIGDSEFTNNVFKPTTQRKWEREGKDRSNEQRKSSADKDKNREKKP